jgi:alpha-beta hydrolase superfamily lysophospholipase
MAFERAETKLPTITMDAVHDVSGSITTSDGRRLFRRSVTPAEPHRATARLALLHGYGDHSGRYLHFTRWLAERGVACHSFDFRGHGRSAGRLVYVRRWDEYLNDLAAFLALGPLRPGAPGGPLFVLGHSHGGLVAATAEIRGMLRDAGVVGCVLSSPYFRGYSRVSAPWHAFARACDRVWPWLRVPTGLGDGAMSRDPEMAADSRADPLIHRVATPRWYLSTLDVQAEAMRRAGEFRLPLLCLIAGQDMVADPAGVREFFAAAGSTDKRLIEYADARHELLRELEREEVFEAVLNWIRERLPATSAG